MTKRDCTGNNQDFNTFHKSTALQTNHAKIIELLDQGIGGVDMARGLLVMGNQTDVLPRYLHDGLAGAIECLVKVRELIEKPNFRM